MFARFSLVTAILCMLFGVTIVVTEVLVLTSVLPSDSGISATWFSSFQDPSGTIMAFGVGIFFILSSIVVFKRFRSERRKNRQI